MNSQFADPEVELLLLLGRAAVEHARKARVEVLLAGPLAWDRLLTLAGRHGLAPLLHWHLSRSFPGRAPATAAKVLETQFQATLQANLKLAGELARILRRLDQQRIPVLLFKGPALAVGLFANLALREFSDLDLLLHPEDILKARDAVLAEGYQAEYPLSPAQERALLRSDCQYTFQKSEGALRIELHWNIVPRYCALQLDAAPWFERPQTVVVGGVPVPALSPEDLLLALCVHGAKHRWGRLAWIADVAELLSSHPGMNWGRIESQARKAGAKRLLLLGLGLVQRLHGEELPAEWLQAIQRDFVVLSMMDQVCRSLGHTGDEPEPWEFHRFLLQALGPGQRARYLLESALTPTPAEWSLISLPGFLWPLYSILRLARLTAKYAGR